MTYFWRPAVKLVTTANSLEIPDRWEELLRCRVVSKAKGQVSVVDQRLEARIEELTDQMQRVEINRQPRTRTERIRRVTTRSYGRR